MTLPRVARLLPVELPLFSMNVRWDAISNSAGEAELQFFEPRSAHFAPREPWAVASFACTSLISDSSYKTNRVA